MQFIRQRSKLNSCTYSYLFNLDLPIDHGCTPWHCADIPYVFHNTELVQATQEPGVTERLEKEIFDSVIAFARTGNTNNSAIPYWPESTPEEERTMVFGKQTELRCNFDEKLVPLAAELIGSILEKEAEKNREKVQH